MPMNPWNKPPEDIGPWYIENAKKWCAKQDGVMLVADSGGKLLGYACVMTRCEEDGTDQEIPYLYGYVADLVVTEKARGQGIGRRLLEACEKLVRDKGQTIFRIGVLAGNEKAIRLYHSFGFKDLHYKLNKQLT